MALTTSQAIEQAKKQLSTRIKKETSAPLSASHDEQGWHVKLEMVEEAKFPRWVDLLVVYNMLLDEEGNMVKFERGDFRRRCLPTTFKW